MISAVVSTLGRLGIRRAPLGSAPHTPTLRVPLAFSLALVLMIAIPAAVALTSAYLHRSTTVPIPGLDPPLTAVIMPAGAARRIGWRTYRLELVVGA